MTQYETIQRQLNRSVPFAQHVGIEVTDVSPNEGKSTIQQVSKISNHIGSIHAGALFTLGEAASGAALAGTFADKLPNIQAVAVDAKISYTKIAKGKIQAQANLSRSADELESEMQAYGKVSFHIDVTLRDELGTEVANMSVCWLIRKNPRDA